MTHDGSPDSSWTINQETLLRVAVWMAKQLADETMTYPLLCSARAGHQKKVKDLKLPD